MQLQEEIEVILSLSFSIRCEIKRITTTGPWIFYCNRIHCITPSYTCAKILRLRKTPYCIKGSCNYGGLALVR
jgi:hypothetical protein